MLFLGILIEAAQDAVPAGLPTTWPTVAAFIGFLVASNLGMWLREIFKHRAWKTKNGTEKVTASTIQDINAKVGLMATTMTEVKTDVKNINTRCVERAKICTDRMKQSEEMIFLLAKNGGKEK